MVKDTTKWASPMPLLYVWKSKTYTETLLVGGFNSSEQYSSVGSIPICGKSNIHVPNHQAVYGKAPCLNMCNRYIINGPWLPNKLPEAI
jgi:hypothetical protein